MALEGVILYAISQAEKCKTVWYHSYVGSKKYSKVVNTTKRKQTHRDVQRTNQWLLVGREKKGKAKHKGRALRIINNYVLIKLQGYINNTEYMANIL